MLEIRGLCKSFAGRAVLSGINLSVAAGECVALLGGNGSGKTTTLRAVAGLVIPDAGTMLVNGRDALRDGRTARAHLSFLPQRPVFPATLTAREVLDVVARLRGLNPLRAGQELAECELLEVAARDVAQLSGGERQRLGLAVALLPDVGLYLFDEPSANLDERALALFSRRVRGLRAAGKAVLFTTHVADDVRHLATRVARLRDGRIAEGAAPAESPSARIAPAEQPGAMTADEEPN
jgi:ABC-2 type transport system ATP-binding protein